MIWRNIRIQFKVLLVVCASPWMQGCGGNSGSTSLDEPRLLPVTITKLSKQSAYEIEDRFLGEVEAARLSDLGFELPGTVVELAVDEGDRVETGQMLARLDVSRLNASRSQQVALITEAQATAKLTEVTFVRISKLAATGAVSSQELDDATQRRDTAVAAVARAEAGLLSIDVDLEKSVLHSPYAGKIATRRVDEGAIVQPGQVILSLIESHVLEARIGLSTEAFSGVNVGSNVTLHHKGSIEPISAKVRQILPQQDRRTRTVDVLLSIPTPGTLVPGDLLEWVVPTKVPGEGFWIPRAALTSSARGLWAAYVAMPTEDSGAHLLERREVEVVHLNGDRAFVRGALQNGDAVVNGGLQRVVPGQKVSLAPTGENGSEQ